MKAEIISIGTELLPGQVVNTDASYAVRALSKLGIDMMFSRTVGGNDGRLKETLTHALKRSDLVITTGDLGSVEDDLTKKTIVEYADAPLIVYGESMKCLKKHFDGRHMGQNQMEQVMLLEGFIVLLNDCGTVSGYAVETRENKIIMMFPSPLSELILMLHNYGTPFLTKRENTSIFSMNVHVFDQGEGAVAEVPSDMTDASNPTAATYAKGDEMYVRITAKMENAQKAEGVYRPVMERIRERIGDCVYGISVNSPEQLVVNLFSKKKMTTVTMESCSGGLLAKRTIDVPGSSQVLEMRVVTYANRIKTSLLGVPEELLEKHGTVSEEVAVTIAEGVWKKPSSDISIDIAGIAESDGSTEEKPTGLIYVGFSDEDGTVVRKVKVFSHRRPHSYHRYTAASFALDMVHRRLGELPL